ncbi:MAG: RagB/SusD family nutrient uptake outer membrane protein [Bacteroidota bacterium]
MKIKYLYLIVCMLVLTSCKKFLDVQPEADVTKEQLFSTEDGFKEALNGAYTYCSSLDLYGGNLTFSNLDIIAQNYEFTDVNSQNIASFKYNDPQWISKADQIWANCYKAIGNCNAILEAIDEKKPVFQGRNYELVKGEALTLRAYLHFDLLRMFAPSYKNNQAAAAIPYVTTVSIKSTPFSSVKDVLEKVIADLSAAKLLLKVSDPILGADYKVGYPDKTYADGTVEAAKATETSNPNLFLQNRRHRMNYFTTCGELARAYLYKDDLANSLLNAKEVIDSKKFPWAKQADVFNSNKQQRDKLFYPELISAWFGSQAVRDHVNNRFSDGNAAFRPTIIQKDLIYELGTVGADDWRYRQWFVDDIANKRANLQKYTWNGSPERNMHPVVAPAIRLSEMFYIAAEATFDTDPNQATAYVDSVRVHRGIRVAIPKNIVKGDFMKKLVEEAKKEFYGESQIFYMHKRLNRDIINVNGMIYPASDKIFVFPMPLDELGYRN